MALSQFSMSSSSCDTLAGFIAMLGLSKLRIKCLDQEVPARGEA